MPFDDARPYAFITQPLASLKLKYIMIRHYQMSVLDEAPLSIVQPLMEAYTGKKE
jgi:hypothetical protein